MAICYTVATVVKFKRDTVITITITVSVV